MTEDEIIAAFTEELDGIRNEEENVIIAVARARTIINLARAFQTPVMLAILNSPSFKKFIEKYSQQALEEIFNQAR